MFTIQCANDDGGRAVAMAMLPPPPTKPITLPWQRCFSGGGKKEEYAKPRTWGRGVSYGLTEWEETGLTAVAVTHKKELIRLWHSISPEPGQSSAQLSKLIRLTACKKTKHTVSRWYWTVYIRWLVAAYDTCKGKRWLNSDRPSYGVKTIWNILSVRLSLLF